MTESFDQYRKRVLSYLGEKDAIKVQTSTPARLAKLTRDLPLDVLRRRPQATKWSIVEILAHLADAELAYSWRLRMMLSRPGVPLQWFDQDDWDVRFTYGQRDAAQLLSVFGALRRNNLELLKRVPRASWKKAFGIHEVRGRQTVADFVTMEAAHDLNHLQQIKNIVNVLRRRQSKASFAQKAK